MDEQNVAIYTFNLDKGLDSYYVDPECDRQSDLNCWDKDGLENLAKEFCKIITDKLAGKPFGVTSHFRGDATFPKLPWQSFFSFANIFLPQAYWKASFGTIGSGKPLEWQLLSMEYRLRLKSLLKQGLS